MNDLEAIYKRCSRRSYETIPISEENIKQLKDAIENINRESGMSIQFVEKGGKIFGKFSKSYGMFSNVPSIISLAAGGSISNALSKAGYYGEKLILLATRLGLGTCFVGATFDKEYCKSFLKDNENLLSIISIGNVAERFKVKEKLIYKATRRKTKSIEELYISDEPIPTWFLDGIRAVQKAPSAMNGQPVTFEYRNGNVIPHTNSDKLHEQIDLGIAILHFEVGSNRTFSDFDPFK